VNTYIADNINEQLNAEIELSRCSDEEKNKQIKRLKSFQSKNKDRSIESLDKLKKVALKGENIFEELLETVQSCSLGQISEVLYEVGGRYRRNM
jgi:methylmalonyl-CoA mutase